MSEIEVADLELLTPMEKSSAFSTRKSKLLLLCSLP